MAISGRLVERSAASAASPLPWISLKLVSGHWVEAALGAAGNALKAWVANCGGRLLGSPLPMLLQAGQRLLLA